MKVVVETSRSVAGLPTHGVMIFMDDDELRRFQRILTAWVNGVHYPGPSTMQFAGDLRDKLLEIGGYDEQSDADGE